ncbi:hypothetical protein DRE_06580 [Drechslerella stenobrocha 248]|uniref:BTB domain-containing protein n=1 Tax=Drechslerella stenobrocha 248 TaxID=1043628 RepID=W7HNF6_9PEZI|nr:hypothetical protein DRE_06580 [Drechslerella stenobrocha 248]
MGAGVPDSVTAAPVTLKLPGFPKPLEDPRFSDITVHVGRWGYNTTPTEYRLHRVLLCERSVYFERLIGDIFEWSDNIVTLPDIPPNAFDIIVRFIYTGEYTHDDKKAGALQEFTDIYQAAEYLSIPDLTTKLLDIILKKVDDVEDQLHFEFVVAMLDMFARKPYHENMLEKVVQRLLKRVDLLAWMAEDEFKRVLNRHGVIGRLILENIRLAELKPLPTISANDCKPNVFCSKCKIKKPVAGRSKMYSLPLACGHRVLV